MYSRGVLIREWALNWAFTVKEKELFSAENKSFSFTPKSVTEESKPKLENEKCFGIDLKKIKVKKELNIKYLIDFYNRLKSTKTDIKYN